MEISIAPNVLFNVGPLAFTNSMTTALLMTGVFALFAWYAKRTFGLIPNRVQVGFEMLVEFIWDQVESAFNSPARAKQLFPLLMSLLLVILIANQLTVIPLIGQIVTDGVPVFRSPTSDLSETIALALITLLTSHFLALKISPLGHIGNFIKIAPLIQARTRQQFTKAIMDLLLGVLDIISEIAKLISLSFRLFGNVIAGELIIIIISGLSFYTKAFVPIPFLVLSIMAGLVQALVFAMLSIQFIAGAVNAAEEAAAGNPPAETEEGRYEPDESTGEVQVKV